MQKAQSKQAVAAVAGPSKSRVRKPKAKPEVLPLPKPKEVKTKDMMGKVTLLVFHCSKLGNRRKIDDDRVTVDADKKWVRATKQLVDSDTLREISANRRGAKKFLLRHSLPLPLGESTFAVPEKYQADVVKELDAAIGRQTGLVKQLGNEWEDLVADGKKRLRSNFDERDYVSKEELEHEFDMRYQFITRDVPISLREDLYNQELKKAEKAGQETREAWMALLREEFSGLVNHLVSRLTPSKDGKKKVLRDSPVANLMEWIATLGPRNVCDDVQLKFLAGKAVGILKGTNLEALREDNTARDQVRKQFQAIKSTLDTMVSLAPSREVSLEED